MSQIKPTQLIAEKEVRPNPSTPFPSDLTPGQRGLRLDPVFTARDSEVDTTGDGDGFGGDEAVAPTTLDTSSQAVVLEESDPIPQTPRVIGVKEQIISFQPDGSAKIDVILEVEDIPGVTEYDIRVAKDSGNL